MHQLTFKLPALPPFRLDLTVWALKRREQNILDCWDGSCYRRVLIIENSPVCIEVQQKAGHRQLSVIAHTHEAIPRLKAQVTPLLKMMLGLNISLQGFYDMFADHNVLHPLVLKFQGVKPPRFPTLFETLANAIAFQQLSLDAGFSILNHFIQKYGKTFILQNHTYYAFPEASEIVMCKKEDLMALGFSQHKSEALINVASTMLHEGIFSHLDQLSSEQVVQELCNLKGIGRWSAEYTLLRGLGKIEILPGDDVAVHNNLEALLKLRKKPDYNTIKKYEKKWYPYAGLLYFHFLLDKLARS